MWIKSDYLPRLTSNWTWADGELQPIESPLDMVAANGNLYMALSSYGISGLGAYPFRDRRWDKPLLTIYGGFSGQGEPVYRYLCEYCFDGVGELIFFRDFKSLHRAEKVR
jgi:hypothetical protein